MYRLSSSKKFSSITPKPSNPLDVKYRQDEVNPTQYVPATKRREIYDFMQQPAVGIATDKELNYNPRTHRKPAPSVPTLAVYKDSKREYSVNANLNLSKIIDLRKSLTFHKQFSLGHNPDGSPVQVR